MYKKDKPEVIHQSFITRGAVKNMVEMLKGYKLSKGDYTRVNSKELSAVKFFCDPYVIAPIIAKD